MSNINSSDRNQTGSIQAFQRDLPKRVRKPSELARGTYLHAELTAPNPPLGVHAPESDIPRSRTVPSSVTQTPPRVQSIRAGPRSYATLTPVRPAEPRQGPVPVSSPSHARRVPPHLGHTSSLLSVSPVLPSPTGPARGNSVSLLLSPTSSLLASCSITPDISVSPFNMLPCGRYRSEDADHRHADGSLTTASLIIRYGARSPDAQPCREGERLRRQKLCRGLRAAYPETIFRDRVRHVMGMWDRGQGWATAWARQGRAAGTCPTPAARLTQKPPPRGLATSR